MRRIKINNITLITDIYNNIIFVDAMQNLRDSLHDMSLDINYLEDIMDDKTTVKKYILSKERYLFDDNFQSNLFHTLLSNVLHDDTLFYYSGHIIAHNNSKYILLPNTELFLSTKLVYILDNLNCKRMLLIVDSCYAESIKLNSTNRYDFIQFLSSSKNNLTLSSKYSSVFTKVIIEKLITLKNMIIVSDAELFILNNNDGSLIVSNCDSLSL